MEDLNHEELLHEMQNIKKLLSEFLKPTPKKIYSPKTLADYLNVSTRTIQNWRDSGKISFTKVGDVILFTQDDIEVFLKRFKKQAFRN